MVAQQIVPSRRRFIGSIEVLGSICTFCQKVYHSAFGPVVGEQKYRKLTLVNAIAIWEQGLPDSQNSSH